MSADTELTPAATTASADEIIEKCRRYTIFEWGPQEGRDIIAVERARGAHFWDSDGKRYLDFSSQAVNVNIGHADPRVIDALEAQAREMPYISPFSATAARATLGERLARLVPMERAKTFLTLGGAEANENAVRTAMVVTGRRKILARYQSYHGGTNAMLSLSGDSRRMPAEPGLPGVVRFWGPYGYRCPWCGGPCDGCVDRALRHLEETILHEGPSTIAALILEPIPGGYGVIVPPDGYLAGVRRICSEHGIMLIADEVMTGLGRAGSWFAVDHEHVVPDIITLAKGLTGGHAPLGACVMSGDLAEVFESKPFPGGLTFNSYPLGCATAVATLDVVEQDGMVERSRDLGELLMRELAELQQRHPSIGDVRGRGLFAAIEVVRNRRTREPLGSREAVSPHQHVMNAFRKRLISEGVFTSVRGNVILIAPPLCIEEADLRAGLAVIDHALEDVDQEVER